MTKQHRTWLVALAAVALAPVAYCELEVPRVRFTDRQFKSFRIDEPVIIAVNPDDLGDVSTLAVRIFPGDPADLVRLYYGKTAEGCYIYESAVVRGAIDRSGFIDLRRFVYGESWLRRDFTGTLKSSTYTLIIERNTKDVRQVKVYERSLDDYFGRGFIFTLIAPPARRPEPAPLLDTVIGAIKDIVSPSAHASPTPAPTTRATATQPHSATKPTVPTPRRLGAPPDRPAPQPKPSVTDQEDEPGSPSRTMPRKVPRPPSDCVVLGSHV
jgi:hypothetical protein